MCNPNCIEFNVINLTREEVEGKRILEIGSLNVNGSVRKIIESYNPKEYIGIYLEKGKGVDSICRAEDIIERYGKESFDIIISNDMVEHVKDWKLVISNMKNICKLGGIIILTTCKIGFSYHGYPHDYWRYEINDMKNIFSDFNNVKVEVDEIHDIFVKAIKPKSFLENDLKDYQLYSIVEGKRIIIATNNKPPFKMIFKDKFKKIAINFGKKLLK